MPLPRYTPQQLSRTADHFRPRESLNAALEGYDPFILDPPYQRGSVWTHEQRVNLVRSLIMGLPIGSIWTSDRGGANGYAIVDGRQRVETLRAWFDDDLAVPAGWFEPRDLPDDLAADPGDALVTYAGLSDTGRRRCTTGWHVGELQVSRLTEQQEAELYLLINFGGVPQADDDRARAATIADS